MKKTTFIIFLVLTIHCSNAQPIVYSNVQPPSCAACCDGSFSITIPGYSICQPSPTLSMLSYTFGPGYTGLHYTNACAITYTLTYTIGTGETTPITEYFTMPTPTGLRSIKDIDELSLFPNPVTDILFTTSRSHSYIIKALDGQSVLSGNVIEKKIGVNTLKPGIYTISLYDNSEQLLAVKRIVKN